tara:strand:+ start:2083 stop:2742 length:660 start_codon:yes stop_codon:yes gene_type:complete
MIANRDLTSNELYINALNILFDLVNDRGFLFDIDVQLKQLQSNVNTKETHIIDCSSKNKSENNLKVVLLFNEGLTIKELFKLITKEVNNMNISDSLVIVLPNKTLVDNKQIESYSDERVCIFELLSLQYNITKHKWVPLHEKVSNREQNIIKHLYSLDTLEKLPLIDVRDPVIKYHGWKSGDVCRVTRYPKLYPRSAHASQNIGSGTRKYVTYRYVQNI